MGIRSTVKSAWTESAYAKYAVYPLTAAIAKASGRGEHLLWPLAVGTVMRYLVNWLFVAMSKMDSLIASRKVHHKNPPASQLQRETDWDGPVVLSPLAFVLVDVLTPFLRADRVIPLNASSLLWLFGAHYGAVEPVYYAFHRWLHGAFAYAKSHHHHHQSTTTEAVSGTSHPFFESVGYLANFSLAFLIPAFFGKFALASIPVYFVWFDVMNCCGHCNFECFPLVSQKFGLKRLVYTTSYHSLHHTKFKCNYALFCPLWDYIFGTVNAATDILHAEVLSQEKPKAPQAVFLAHGHDDASMLTHVPWLSPLRSSKAHCELLPFGLDIFLTPIFVAWALLCRYLMPTACVQRYSYRGTKCATWCLPVSARFYLDPRERPSIQKMVLAAVREADDSGVEYVGLAALNKAEWLNRGGREVEEVLIKEQRKVKVVHGNSLTAAAVLESVKRADPEVKAVIALTAATSKVGRALALSMAARGNTVLMLTTAPDRFQAIVDEAFAKYGSQTASRMRRIETYSEGKQLADVWVLGKLVRETTIATSLRGRTDLEGRPAPPLLIDFAVPHLAVPNLEKAPYRYINGAALKYEFADTDLTFCHDLESTVPACLAATIIHARDKDLVGHETGEVDVDSLATWWNRAKTHGFDLSHKL